MDKIYFIGHIIAKISKHYGFLDYRAYKNFCKKQIADEATKKNIDLKKELWKEVPGYEGGYLVSNYGRVKSKKRKNSDDGTFLKIAINKSGYPFVMLSMNGVKKNYPVHRLVWISFKGGVDDRMEVDHKNSIKSDSRLSNLQLLNRKQNHKKAVSQNKNDIKKYLKMLDEI